jgi:hypothetical protein
MRSLFRPHAAMASNAAVALEPAFGRGRSLCCHGLVFCCRSAPLPVPETSQGTGDVDVDLNAIGDSRLQTVLSCSQEKRRDQL